MELLDACFEMVSTLSEVEKSTLYYIAGYVASKEHLCQGRRRQNAHMLRIYKCVQHMLIAFLQMYECYQLEYEAENRNLRRFCKLVFLKHFLINNAMVFVQKLT